MHRTVGQVGSACKASKLSFGPTLFEALVDPKKRQISGNPFQRREQEGELDFFFFLSDKENFFFSNNDVDGFDPRSWIYATFQRFYNQAMMAPTDDN